VYFCRSGDQSEAFGRQESGVAIEEGARGIVVGTAKAHDVTIIRSIVVIDGT